MTRSYKYGLPHQEERLRWKLYWKYEAPRMKALHEGWTPPNLPTDYYEMKTYTHCKLKMMSDLFMVKIGNEDELYTPLAQRV